ncbi:KaiC [uncultured archaeon]|nr:KaiC [uncultured archaeon]
MNCIHCGKPLLDGKYRCVNPKCRMWNIASTVSMDDSIVPLGGKDTKPVERVKIGIADKCFGGAMEKGAVIGKGIAKLAVVLMGGDPGAGKTTLCLQISNEFARTFKRKVLYIANEQHYTELNDTAMRLDLADKELIYIVKAMGGVQHDIGAMLLQYKPCLTILDSVTKWSGEDVNEAVTICQRLKDYTVRLNSPTIVINQVTKSGDHSGLNKMQHAVDATMLFEILGENPQDPRRLHVRKNRHGLAPISEYFEMTELGVFEISEDDAMVRLSGPPKPLPSLKADKEKGEDESESDEEEGSDEDEEDDESESQD